MGAKKAAKQSRQTYSMYSRNHGPRTIESISVDDTVFSNNKHELVENFEDMEAEKVYYYRFGSRLTHSFVHTFTDPTENYEEVMRHHVRCGRVYKDKIKPKKIKKNGQSKLFN